MNKNWLFYKINFYFISSEITNIKPSATTNSKPSVEEDLFGINFNQNDPFKIQPINSNNNKITQNNDLFDFDNVFKAIPISVTMPDLFSQQNNIPVKKIEQNDTMTQKTFDSNKKNESQSNVTILIN